MISPSTTAAWGMLVAVGGEGLFVGEGLSVSWDAGRRLQPAANRRLEAISAGRTRELSIWLRIITSWLPDAMLASCGLVGIHQFDREENTKTIGLRRV